MFKKVENLFWNACERLCVCQQIYLVIWSCSLLKWLSSHACRFLMVITWERNQSSKVEEKLFLQVKFFLSKCWIKQFGSLYADVDNTEDKILMVYGQSWDRAAVCCMLNDLLIGIFDVSACGKLWKSVMYQL